MKEKLNYINSFPILTDEQKHIVEELLDVIQKEEKEIIGINSQVGDGKTYLLNVLIYASSLNKNHAKLRGNIFESTKVLIIDDLDQFDRYFQMELISKNKKTIIFTYNNESKIFIEFKKIFMSHKYRLSCLDIKHFEIFTELSLLSSYPFRVLKQINNDLLNDVHKNEKINKKNIFLFYQKKFEKIYGKYWSEIKKLVKSSENVFPKINFQEGLKYKEIYLSNGWIYKKEKDYYFNNDDILFFLIIRDNISDILKGGFLTSKINYYFEKSKVFQKSLINLVDTKKISFNFECKEIYLSSILELQNMNLLYAQRIVFDLISISEVIKFLSNDKLIDYYPLSYLLNNVDKITVGLNLSDNEMQSLNKKFCDVKKLILLCILLMLDEYKDLRFFNEINWLKSIETFNFFSSIEDSLDLKGSFFSLYCLNVAAQKNKKIENSGIFKLLKSKINDFAFIDLWSENELLTELRHLNSKEFSKKLFYTDVFFYFFKKGSFIQETSSDLSIKFKELNISHDCYKNDLLKPFNLLLIMLFLRIKEENYVFFKWFKLYINDIAKGQYEGFPSKKGLLHKNEYNFLYVMKEAILLNSEIDRWKDTELYGRIVKKNIIQNEIQYWTKLKKQYKKQNFVTAENAIDLIKLFNEMIVRENDDVFLPINAYIEYSKFTYNTKNKDCFPESHYEYLNKIELTCSSKNFKMINLLDNSEFNFPTRFKNYKNYKIIHWKNSENDWGYILLSNLKKFKNLKYELVLWTKQICPIPDINYVFQYKFKNNCIELKIEEAKKH